MDPSPASGGERLRALTDALVAVGAGLDLDEVLQRIATTAATLTRARYAALAINGSHGGVTRFVTHGLPAEMGERVAGTSADHPLMRAFLGVPIRVHGRIFGNLHVAEKEGAGGGLFTGDDEESLLALGAAAGVAVENARLYAGVQCRQRWADAAGVAINAVLATGAGQPPQRLAAVPAIALAAAGSQAAAVASPRGEGTWVIRHPAGEAVQRLAELTVTGPVARLLSALAEVRAVSGGEIAEEASAWRQWRLVPVPGVGERPSAVVLLGWLEPPEPAIDPTDADVLASFGQRVGLALQVAQGHADAAALALLRDRDRIARDLHDLVIQRLFAVGLSLRAAHGAARVPEVRDRLARAAQDVDETIKDMRRSIFDLHGSAVGSHLRARIEEVLTEARAAFAGEVTSVVDGPLLGIPDDIAEDLVAVMREAVSNAVRHAGASRIEAFLTVGPEIELEVVDDGRGIVDPDRRSGLANLCERAARHGGTCEVGPGPGVGTALRWAVPLRRPGPVDGSAQGR